MDGVSLGAQLQEAQETIRRLTAEKERLDKCAKVFRLEDAINAAENPSDLHRRLRSFELAAYWKLKAVEIDRRCATLQQELG
jgi:hypothetical protein